MFEKARDVYEEGLTSVVTVHDFSLIFDALAQVTEGSCKELFYCHIQLLIIIIISVPVYRIVIIVN